MRSPYPLLLLLALATQGCATKDAAQQSNQQAAKEAAKTIQPSQTSTLRSLSERIENPDRSMTFVPQGTGFVANKTFQGKPAYVKDFYVNQKPYVKSFKAKSWWGSKKDTQVDKTFGTKTARTKGDYKTEEYSTDQYRTKDWYYAKKAMPVEEYATNESTFKGTRQEEFDRQNAKVQAMTVDDVRALLNKNE